MCDRPTGDGGSASPDPLPAAQGRRPNQFYLQTQLQGWFQLGPPDLAGPPGCILHLGSASRTARALASAVHHHHAPTWWQHAWDKMGTGTVGPWTPLCVCVLGEGASPTWPPLAPQPGPAREAAPANLSGDCPRSSWPAVPSSACTSAGGRERIASSAMRHRLQGPWGDTVRRGPLRSIPLVCDPGGTLGSSARGGGRGGEAVWGPEAGVASPGLPPAPPTEPPVPVQPHPIRGCARPQAQSKIPHILRGALHPMPGPPSPPSSLHPHPWGRPDAPARGCYRSRCGTIGAPVTPTLPAHMCLLGDIPVALRRCF
ncbi:MAPK-interacting and spindle-stabilizing protein-like [Canis lupus dingo]|uniref:MAPK-interacting and spindle-stabilizing protein-like n=1 Tax=Canis lupus dingo TaxID=286419 RepID=UPI0020C487AC|nr:MAPK-interacting and spindle-stabilizing protein-like [Canis lupus dingo]